MVSLSLSPIYMLIEELGTYKTQHKPLYLPSLSLFLCVFQNGIKQFQHILTLSELFVTDTDTTYIHFIHPLGTVILRYSLYFDVTKASGCKYFTSLTPPFIASKYGHCNKI